MFCLWKNGLLGGPMVTLQKRLSTKLKHLTYNLIYKRNYFHYIVVYLYFMLGFHSIFIEKPIPCRVTRLSRSYCFNIVIGKNYQRKTNDTTSLKTIVFAEWNLDGVWTVRQIRILVISKSGFGRTKLFRSYLPNG